MKLERGLILAALVVLVLGYMPARAQTTLSQPGVPVTTPDAANAPASDKPSPNVPATAAVPVQQVPSPAAPSHAEEQVLWALIVSYAIQYAKKSPLVPFLNEESTGRLKAIVGFVAAVATAAGIHFAVTGSVLDGGGAAVTITGISLDGVKDVVFQWAAQQGWFDLLTHRREL